MCLFDNRKYRFTFKRKKIYKCLLSEYYINGEDHYLTPFTYFKVIFSGKETVMIPEELSNPIKENKLYKFEKGFIHTFDSKQQAISFANLIPSCVVFEGYIPLFTRYAKAYQMGTLCARKVVLTKQLK